MTTSNFNFASGEVLNINKPEGWSSFDVVKKVRYAAREKRVGHAGTLDPFASGVLLVCTGSATKQVSELMNFDKEYLAEIEFGKTTDTYDRTGVVLSETDTQSLEISEIKSSVQQFVGEIYQTPPMYSAIKVQGERLYKLARRGEVIERAPRKIRIHELQVVGFTAAEKRATLKVVCSKGTYIRSLAHDLGGRLGCGAYLSSLVRTRIGPHRIENAWTIDALVASIHLSRQV
ncbi:MAG TPA: tRNA pseudouridine(55) synthase TruB [bacterium]